MKVFRSVGEATGAPQLRGCALCLGNFDGVHLGHQALISTAAKFAPAAVLTFHPHPGKVLQPILAPKLIVSESRKLELFEQYRVEWAIVQPFTLQFSTVTAAEFEKMILDELGATYVIVGQDFTYGVKRSGNVESLDVATRARRARLCVVPAVTELGVVVSSSKIREYLLEGRVDAAARLLGRRFDLDGTVVRGAGRGRTIGFPTANIDPECELRPAAGVYAVRVREIDLEGPWITAAVNIGAKPTFGGTEITIEAHLVDFSGDLYGKRLRVEFLERLRGEQRFASAGDLISQIRRDVEATRLAAARVN